MKINLRLVNLVFLILFTSCLAKENEIATNDLKKPNQIVLIFTEFPQNYVISLNDTRGKAYTTARPELRYFDDHLIQQVLRPRTGTSDTIAVRCDRQWIEFQHSVKGIDNFDYIFQNGDTVIFNYDETKTPRVKIINRDVSDFETNYDLYHREAICSNGYPALLQILMPFIFVKYNSNYIGSEGERGGILGQIDNTVNEARFKFEKETELEKAFLDSLLDESLLSADAYKWLNQKLQHKILTEKAYCDKLKKPEIKTVISNEFDSLLKYHSYRSLVTTVSSTFYDRKVPRILSSNSNLPDYEIVYDSILKSKLFSEKTKEILLIETSGLLIRNSGSTKIKAHIEKLRRDIKDTFGVSYLLDKYELRKETIDDIDLEYFDGEKTTLRSVIAENPHKVVYVDFWASWCGPCIKEFPQSKKLMAKFNDGGILFLYLSIDDDANQWITSSKKNALPDQYSFLVKNKKTSKLLEKLGVNLIPRYVIFNKTGEVIYEEAPRPGDPEITRILDNLMTNAL